MMPNIILKTVGVKHNVFYSLFYMSGFNSKPADLTFIKCCTRETHLIPSIYRNNTFRLCRNIYIIKFDDSLFVWRNSNVKKDTTVKKVTTFTLDLYACR